MNALRPGLPPLPERMADLPVESRGYPVPFFVAWIDGKPDFRVIEAGRIAECVRGEKCWLCGERLGAFKAFVIGPMCAVNRTSSEPPSHRECAIFAATACPFLVMPKAQRREANLPEGNIAGVSIPRNPGVALVWVSKRFRLFGDNRGGVLFDIGEPVETLWFAEGRAAMRAEVMASIESGLPSLRAMAQGEEDLAELAKMVAAAEVYLPRESADAP